MSPFCCSNKQDPHTELQFDENASKQPLTEQTQVSESCCTGAVCCCNDTCFDKLVRAICADDDGHIHTAASEDAPDIVSLASDGSSLCEDATANESQAACMRSHAGDKEEGAAAENTKTHPSSLRKRKVPKHKGQLPVEACGKHESLARNRYTDTLAAFGCVCKAMLARGLQSCCAPPPPIGDSLFAPLLSVHHAKKSKSSVDSCAGSCCENASVNTRSRSSVDSHCRKECCAGSFDEKPSIDSCCAGGRCTAESPGDIRSLRRSARASFDSCGSRSCCKESVVQDNIDAEKLDNPADIRSLRRSTIDSCCSQPCCAPIVKDSVISEKLGGVATSISSPTNVNHAVLSIKGMTCAGCENKLARGLRAQAAISSVKTSLVLARAEFDYSGDAGDLPFLIDAIHKYTGFGVEQIETLSSIRSLELVIEGKLQEKVLLTTYPAGVREVTKTKSKAVHVVYDPHIIGARDVLAHYADFSPILAPQPGDPTIAAGEKHIRMLLTRTLFSATLTIPVLVMTWAPLPAHEHAYVIASLVLASAVQIIIAGPFYVGALKGLFYGLIESDLIIVLSTTAAFVYSVVAFAFEMIGRPLSGGSFFETSTLLVTLIMCGQLASAFARQRAIVAISLRSLQQKTAMIVVTRWDGRVEEQNVDVRLLHYDDTFRVAPDSVIITDGVILSGSSSVDESMMTGESLPVEKSVGSEVLAGTTNGAGSLLVKVTRLPGENTISDIASMVDDARLSRARVQSIVDRIITWFVPVVLAIAIATFVIWILVGIRVRKQSAGEAAVKALTYAIAVLAISCPCAIGLAVPMVVLVASGVAARLGLVFKAATTIEAAKNITHAVFDKTGTLTLGRLEVVHADVLVNDPETKSALWALTSASHHPVARAVAEYLVSSGVVNTSKVLDIKGVTGKGLEGTLDGQPIRGGNAQWLGLEDDPSVKASMTSGLTTFCVTYNNRLIATFTLSDTLRPETSTVLATLSARGARISILSGDHAAAVVRVASMLNVPPEQVRAGCLPADKAAYIRALQARGEKVLFCGDGTNDAVALAQADIGVHMSSEGSGASAGAAASSAADAVLIRPSLAGIVALMDLSMAVHRRIVLNFAWSAVYNLVAVLFAGGAFVNARISPAYAGLGEIVSVLPVVLIAMQLKWFKAD